MKPLQLLRYSQTSGGAAWTQNPQIPWKEATLLVDWYPPLLKFSVKFVVALNSLPALPFDTKGHNEE
jgi:hypothetical protein